MIQGIKEKVNLQLISTFTLFIILRSICFSQTIPDSSKSESLISTVAGDVAYVAASPFHMSKVGAIKFVSFIALNAGLMYKVDEPVDEELAVEGYHDYLKPAERLADIGDAYDRIGPATVLAGVTTTLLVSGIIFKDRKLLETTRLVIESALITGLLTHAGKRLLNRSRPYADRGASDFHLFKFSGAHKNSSFPSGHSSNIFSLITVVTKQYPSWWLKIPAYTLGVSVCLQRIDDRQHWTSDVVAGSFLGFWVGSRLVKRTQTRSHQISIYPYFRENQIGMRLMF